MRPGVPFSSAAFHADSTTIVERFRNEGYLDVRVSSVESFTGDSTGVDLAITIQEGRKTLLGSLAITGNTVVSTEESIPGKGRRWMSTCLSPISRRSLPGMRSSGIRRQDAGSIPSAWFRVKLPTRCTCCSALRKAPAYGFRKSGWRATVKPQPE